MVSNFFSAYSLNALTRRKDILSVLTTEIDDEELKPVNISTATSVPRKLKKELNLYDVIAYGLSATIGAGIYSIVGPAVAIAGPGIAISFVLGAVTGIFTGLAYAEFASRVPCPGSAYSYSYVSFGELIAFW